VHCPRCGTPNDDGDRFCSACGAELRRPSAPEEPVPAGERLRRIVGTTRKARLITAATVLAFAVAIAAFIALKPSEDTIPRDAYTIAADHLCLNAKREIVVAERQSSRVGTSVFASELVPIVAAWRSRLHELRVPPDRIEQAKLLEAALLEAEVKMGTLARVAEGGGKQQILASAKQADTASADVEEAVSALGLSRCADARIGLSRRPS
jgi:zinc ribbon protein